MAVELSTRLTTAEDFMDADLGEGTFELVRGEIVPRSSPGSEHGLTCANLTGILWDYGRRTGLGYTLSNDSAVLTRRRPDTVRGADVSFYTHARWPRDRVSRALPPVAPDLVVEVASPGNRPGAMLEKVGEYLDAGVLMVWVAYPKSRTIAVYRASDAAPVVLQEDQSIEDLPELPGFQRLVAEVFR